MSADDVDAHASSLTPIDTGLQGRACSSPAPRAGSAPRARAPSSAEGARVRRPLPPRRERARGAGGGARRRCRRPGRPHGRGDVERLFDEARTRSAGSTCAPRSPGVWPSEDVPVWELPLERWEETLRANLTATFLTARGVPARGRARAATARSSSSARRPASSARPVTPTTRPRSPRSSAASSAPEERDRADRPGARERRRPAGRDTDDARRARRGRCAARRGRWRSQGRAPEDVAQVVVLASDSSPATSPDRSSSCRRHGRPGRPTRDPRRSGGASVRPATVNSGGAAARPRLSLP